MNKWLVIQKTDFEGYQDAFGPYSTKENALAAAQEKAENDPFTDNEYIVFLVTRNGLTDPQGWFRPNGAITLHLAQMENLRRANKSVSLSVSERA